MNDVTRLIECLNKGDESASASLIEAVYDELRQMAANQMSKENAGHTLQATALVNEAFIRLFQNDSNSNWKSRAHFFGAAAEAMRRILVDHARQKKSLKRGGQARKQKLTGDIVGSEFPIEEILDVHEALDQLELKDERKARLVKLRYFAGLNIEEAAELMKISVPTANRYWAYARAWLFDRIHSE